MLLLLSQKSHPLEFQIFELHSLHPSRSCRRGDTLGNRGSTTNTAARQYIPVKLSGVNVSVAMLQGPQTGLLRLPVRLRKIHSQSQHGDVAAVSQRQSRSQGSQDRHAAVARPRPYYLWFAHAHCKHSNSVYSSPCQLCYGSQGVFIIPGQSVIRCSSKPFCRN